MGRPPGRDSGVLDPRVGTLAAWGSGPALPGDQLLYYEDPKAIMEEERETPGKPGNLLTGFSGPNAPTREVTVGRSL